VTRSSRLKRWLSVAGWLGLVTCPCVAAQEPLTLPRVIDIALRGNPDVLQARLRVDSAHAERRIARALPNPVYAGIPGNPYQYSVSLPIDLTPARLYRARASRSGEEMTTLSERDVTRQVLFDVRRGFYDLLLADADRQLAGERRDILRQILSADSVRLRAGDIPERDLVKSTLEFARAEADLTRAEAAVRGARLALQALMGVAHPDTAITVSGQLEAAPTLTLPIDSLLPLAIARRPDIAAARSQVDQNRALEALATADLFPAPVVSLVYQNTPFPSGRRYDVGVAVPIPLFNWNGGERQRAHAGLTMAEVAMRRAEVQVETEVAAAIGAFRSAQVLADRYQSGLLAQATAALQTSRFAYQQGAISLLELLDAIRSYADTRAEYAGAVHDYWVAAYGLSRAVGIDVVRE
jgi:cobalt-zinc-cadmium efflux system outer membrane protein